MSEERGALAACKRIFYYSLPWAHYCIKFDLDEHSFITWFRSEAERERWYRDFLNQADEAA